MAAMKEEGHQKRGPFRSVLQRRYQRLWKNERGGETRGWASSAEITSKKKKSTTWGNQSSPKKLAQTNGEGGRHGERPGNVEGGLQGELMGLRAPRPGLLPYLGVSWKKDQTWSLPLEPRSKEAEGRRG